LVVDECQRLKLPKSLYENEHVEDGKFKMKEKCAILTDLGLREKAIQIIMNYNSPWLQIRLYIVI